MKRIFAIGIILGAMGCTTAATQTVSDTPPSPVMEVGPFEVAEADGRVVHRMHADGPAYVALVAGADGLWQIVRLEQRDGAWVVVDTQPGREDYLWPSQ